MEENNHVAKDYRRIYQEILLKEPGICHDLVVIKTYAQMIHEAVDALEGKIGKVVNDIKANGF